MAFDFTCLNLDSLNPSDARSRAIYEKWRSLEHKTVLVDGVKYRLVGFGKSNGWDRLKRERDAEVLTRLGAGESLRSIGRDVGLTQEGLEADGTHGLDVTRGTQKADPEDRAPQAAYPSLGPYTFRIEYKLASDR